VSVWICEVKYDCQLPIVEWLGPWIPGIGGGGSKVGPRLG